MTATDILTMLKVNLGLTSTAYDQRLSMLIETAREEITREGITIAEQPEAPDANLLVMYADWLWRKRDSGEGMPRMLRYALNNRLFQEKIAGTKPQPEEDQGFLMFKEGGAGDA